VLDAAMETLDEVLGDFERAGEVSMGVRRRWTGTQRLTTTDAEGNMVDRNAWSSSHPIGEAKGVAILAPGVR
jgi:hypothetical protein